MNNEELELAQEIISDEISHTQQDILGRISRTQESMNAVTNYILSQYGEDGELYNKRRLLLRLSKEKPSVLENYFKDKIKVVTRTDGLRDAVRKIVLARLAISLQE